MLGEGPLRDTVRAWIAAEGLGDALAAPGAVPELAPWLAAADAVVLSSRSEGAPLVVLEAKVLGRPAIATAVGGVPDLVQHGVDGWWVPPGSGHELARALDVLAEDPGLLRRLGAAAAVDVEARFGRDRLAEDTIRIYERVSGSVVASPG
jgi:glycosyltransferase involved in cell wall biosynthesis